MKLLTTSTTPCISRDTEGNPCNTLEPLTPTTLKNNS